MITAFVNYVYQNVSNGVSGIRHRVNVSALWENVGNRVMSRQTFKKIAPDRQELHLFNIKCTFLVKMATRRAAISRKPKQYKPAFNKSREVCFVEMFCFC